MLLDKTSVPKLCLFVATILSWLAATAALETVTVKIGLHLFGKGDPLSPESIRAIEIVTKMALRENLNDRASIVTLTVTDQIPLDDETLSLLLSVTGGRANTTISEQWLVRTIGKTLISIYSEIVSNLRAQAHQEFASLVVPNNTDDIVVLYPNNHSSSGTETSSDSSLEFTFLVVAVTASVFITVVLLTLLLWYITRRNKSDHTAVPVQNVGVPPFGWVRRSSTPGPSPSEESVATSDNLKLPSSSPPKNKPMRESSYPTGKRLSPVPISPDNKDRPTPTSPTSPTSEGDDIKNWTFSTVRTQKADHLTRTRAIEF
jgi:hypothetical protein